MGRSKRERYDEAIDYLTALNPVLGADVGQKILAQADDADHATDTVLGVGKEISLKGAGFWNTGTKGQHGAVRALLLCQVAYFRPPHAPQAFASPEVLASTRTRCLNLSETQLRTEILEYLPAATPALDDLASAAETVKDVTGVVDHLQRRRTDTNVSSAPVCYHGVCSWLFASGFVSKRWLARAANTLNAYTCNTHLGDGIVLDDADEWEDIPRGWIWNIHRKGDKTTCHWGVSLGGGFAVACNNTDESPFMKLEYETDGQTGRKGDTFYGVFKMEDICSCVNGTVKYGHASKSKPTMEGQNIVVRAINPLHQAYY